MAYRVSQTDPDTLTTEELLAEIDGFKVLAVEVVERLSLILQSLKKRRQPHPFFQDRILRFWANIADQSLDPEAAILLANKHTISAILPLARSEQVAIAKGQEVATVNFDENGQLKVENMPIFRMDQAMLTRVFGPDGIRSTLEQEKIIRSDARKMQKIGRVSVLMGEKRLKIGAMKVSPDELRPALLRLGVPWVLR